MGEGRGCGHNNALWAQKTERAWRSSEGGFYETTHCL